MLPTPKFLFSTWTSLLNSRQIYQNAYSTASNHIFSLDSQNLWSSIHVPILLIFQSPNRKVILVALFSETLHPNSLADHPCLQMNTPFPPLLLFFAHNLALPYSPSLSVTQQLVTLLRVRAGNISTWKLPSESNPRAPYRKLMTVWSDTSLPGPSGISYSLSLPPRVIRLLPCWHLCYFSNILSMLSPQDFTVDVPSAQNALP